MISVVIPLYNKAEFIAKTIESVLAQTFQDFEIVVVNDGSTDGSAEVVESIKDSRIRIIHQENAGVSAARNNGIEHAKFEWVALLDGDDIWKPEYLQTQWNLHLKYPECDVCTCNYEFCDHTGKVTPTKINKLPFNGENGILSNYFEVASCSHPPICSISIMAKRSAFLAVGGFPVGATLGEDLLMWVQLVCLYHVSYSRKSVAYYNFRSQKQLVTPRRAPDIIDIIGDQFCELSKKYNMPFQQIYFALWHKMRMSTFVRLGMRNDAIVEFKRIKYYNGVNIIVLFWMVLNLLPHKIVRFILFQIAKFK